MSEYKVTIKSEGAITDAETNAAKTGRLIIDQEGIQIPYTEGETILEAVRKHADTLIDTPCSGTGKCGKCRVRILEGKVSDIGETQRSLLSEADISRGIRLACLTRGTGDVVIELSPRAGKAVVLDEVGDIRSGEKPLWGERSDGMYAVAVDIGTTTVAAALVELDSNTVVARSSDVNPQTVVGGDVLTRIAYAMRVPEGLAGMQKMIADRLNSLTNELIEKAGISSDKIKGYAVAANCTMLHILLGIDPSPIGRAPYVPVFTEGKMLKAQDAGITSAGADAMLYCLPSVSAFIGADITAGIYMSGLNTLPGNSLFIDIGTNGEIVLSAGGKLYACSCAVGPALEGMNITCGMRAAEGAVDSVRYTGRNTAGEQPKDIHHADADHDGGDIVVTTIGGGEPVGICGSGVLDAVAALLKAGAVASNGKLTPDKSGISERYYEKDRTKAYILASGSKGDIIFTQKDIRQIQLAKGAILSGFKALLKEAGLAFNDLDRLIIAGQFGSHLNVETLTATGIVPAELADKVVYIGNSSLTGACSVLTDRTLPDRLETLVGEVSYIELARLPDYSKLLMECLNF